MKRCSKCGEERAESEFNRSKARPDGLHPICKPCRRAYYQQTQVQRRAKAKEWAAKHPGAVAARAKQWRENNPERALSLAATHWKVLRADPERYAAYLEKRRTGAHKKAWREANKAREAKRQRRHQQEHPEQWAAYAAKRRARKAGNGGEFTAEEWLTIKSIYDYTCLRCWRREPDIVLTMDHVVPISKGGRHEADNIQPLCLACNSAKHDDATDYRP